MGGDGGNSPGDRGRAARRPQHGAAHQRRAERPEYRGVRRPWRQPARRDGASRRRNLQTLAPRLPVPKVYGPPEGNILLVGWGSTRGPICEAVDKARAKGDSVSSLHLKHLNPLPNGLNNIFDGFNHILVAELN